MRYKTTIQVVTEAKDKAEAIEIVGEYLSGDIFSGVEMRCATRALNGVRKAVITVTALSVLLTAGFVSLYFMKPASQGVSCISASSAVQAPLQTPALGVRDAQFKDQWQKEHTKEALRKIKFSR